MNAALWTAQILLTLIFLFTGTPKLVMPIAELTKQMPGTAWFIRPLGVAEVLGAIGVTLPWLLGVWPALTPLAASSLIIIIMIGATVYSVHMGAGVLALIPVVVGCLAAFVAYGRWRLVPRPPRRLARLSTRRAAGSRPRSRRPSAETRLRVPGCAGPTRPRSRGVLTCPP